MASARGRRFRRRQGITAEDLVEAFDPQAEVVRGVTEIYLQNIQCVRGQMTGWQECGIGGRWSQPVRAVTNLSGGGGGWFGRRRRCVQVIPSNHKSSEAWDRFVNCLAV